MAGERFLQLLFTTIFLLQNAGATDPCHSYDTINDWTRSVGNTKVTSTKCDSFLKEGWYRITGKAGDKMPTKCPVNGFRCGTLAPIWLNGTYPKLGQINNVTACASHFGGDCCKNSYPIQVKNCTRFHVYKLVPTNVCPQAYCFGSEIPCALGETSDNGFTPGCELDPCYQANFEIIAGQLKRSSNYTLRQSDVPIDDSNLKKGWYKIQSDTGNDIVMTQQGMNQCGTKYPVWMKGSLPIGQKKVIGRKICLSGKRGFCQVESDIKIKDCGKFRVYLLSQLPMKDAGYCFGNKPVKDEIVRGDDSFVESCDIPWIVVVCVLVLIILILVVLFFAKKKHTVEDTTLPPPYTAKVEDGHYPVNLIGNNERKYEPK